MGLDMFLEGEIYFFSPRTKNESGHEKKKEVFELGYWRKHPNLHGFIVQQFAGGEDNCQPIELSEENLLSIIAAIEAENLPHTTGFFFGSSDGRDKEEDLKILRSAIEWEKQAKPGESRSIIYNASW